MFDDPHVLALDFDVTGLPNHSSLLEPNSSDPPGIGAALVGMNSLTLEQEVWLLAGNGEGNADEGKLCNNNDVISENGVDLFVDQIKISNGAQIDGDVLFNPLSEDGLIGGHLNSPLILPINDEGQTATDDYGMGSGGNANQPLFSIRQSKAVARATETAATVLRNYVDSPDFLRNMQSVFGDTWQPELAAQVVQTLTRQPLLSGINIVAVPNLEAKGAFGHDPVSGTPTLYLSPAFVDEAAGQPEQIVTVLLEELGHYLDSQLNDTDTRGDEGALFAALVEERSLTTQAVAQLRAEDDHGHLQVNGHEVAVEFSDGTNGNTFDFLVTEGAPENIVVVAGEATEAQTLRFQWTQRDAAFNNELGVFLLEDDQGRVNGLLPGEAGYAQAALSSASRQVLFASGEQAGAWAELMFNGGDRLGFYLIQDGTTENWLASNPQNQVNQGPVAFFAIEGTNPDGVSHVQSAALGEGLARFSWEDLTGGGDQDFDDVIFTISEPGFKVPGQLGQTTPIAITLAGLNAGFNNEMGLFTVDDAQGRVNGLLPGDEGYAEAALAAERRQLVFAQSTAVGTTTPLDLPSGTYLGFYLVQDASTEAYLSQSANGENGGPSIFFSYPQANQDGLSHVHPVALHEFAWEDLTGGGDRDFDDWLFSLEFGEPFPDLSPPDLSVNNITVNEEDDAATFTVSLSEPTTETVTVDFETSNQTSIAGSDYEAANGTLTFVPGETTQTLLVPLLEDEEVEGDETFLVTLSNAAGAVLVDAQGQATIADNDVIPPNQAPAITTEPDIEVLAGQAYEYNARATDPDNDELTYQLQVAPEGMSIDPQTGAIAWRTTASNLGSISVQVLVEDGKGGSDSQTFQVTVLDSVPNRPPLITSIPVMSANIGTEYIYQVTATDPDQDDLAYAIAQGPEGLEIDADTGEIQWTPAAETPLGGYDVTVEVTDGNSGRAEQDYQLVLLETEGNQAPVIVSHPITQINLGDEVAGEPIPVDLSTWLTINYEDSQAFSSWEILPDTNNTEVIQTINSAPSIFIGDFELANSKVEGNWRVSTPADDDLIGFVFGYQDEGHFYLFDWKRGTQNFRGRLAEIGMSVKVVSADTPLTGPDLWPSQGNGDRVRTIYRNNIGWENLTDYGFSLEFLNSSFTITVTEQGTGTVLDSFTLQDDTYPDGKFGFYNYSQSDVEYKGFSQTSLSRGTYLYDTNAIDPENDSLTYEFLDAPNGMTINTDTGLVRWGLQTDSVGTHQIQVQVKDGRGGSDLQTYELEVTDQDDFGEISGTISLDSTTANPGPDPLLGQPNVQVYLDLNNNGVKDADEPSQITTQDNPNTLTVNELGQYQFTDLFDGTYTVRQVVPDGYSQITPAANQGYTAEIVAAGSVENLNFTNQQSADFVNQAPTITSEPNTSFMQGQRYSYQVVASDANADTLTYDLPVKPAGMVIDPESGLIAWNPEHGQVGRTSIVVRVRDGNDGVDLQTYDLDILPPNTAPMITSAPPTQAGVNVPLVYQVVAQDEETDILTYTLENGPVGAGMDSETGLVSWVPDAVGQGEFTVVVTDPRGARATQSFAIEAIADFANNAPTISSTPRNAVRVGDTYRYQIIANDVDNEPLAYSLDDAPAGMTVSPAGLIEWVSTAAQFGANAVALTVTDSRGATAQQSFTVTVGSQTTNEAPIFESEPPQVAIAGETLIYQPVVTDPDGDELAFYSPTILNPFAQLQIGNNATNISAQTPGFSINDKTGEVNWTPDFDDVGPKSLAISATDPYGGTTNQLFEFEVVAGNRPPLFTSVPITQGAVGDNYTYTIAVSDPDGGDVMLSLEEAPNGMTLDGMTLVWQPGATQLGSSMVVIRATDEPGASTTQTYDLEVTDILPNRAPVINSVPSFVATPETLYQYQVTATDPEGEAIAYSLENAPLGVTMDLVTGLLEWTPSIDQVGVAEITLKAVDPTGLGSVQTFSVAVALNTAPTIESTPDPEVSAGDSYQYDVQASDAEGDRLSYRLVQGPAGMTIDSLGRLIGDTTSADIGTFDVEIEVSDSRGLTTSQSYQLAVSADTEAPMVTLIQNNTVVELGEAVTFQVNGTDNVGVESLALTIDGVPVALDANGRADVVLDGLTPIEAVATATDAAGNVGTDTATAQAIDSSDVNAPFLEITSINDGDIFTAPAAVIGSVTDDNLVSYSLSIAPFGTSEFVEIASGTEVITNAEIGTFDPTLFANDSYILRLSATDAGGSTSTLQRQVNVGGNLKLGNFRLSFEDLSIPVTGFPITVTRDYDTLNVSRQDDFGFGWTLGVFDVDLRTDVPASGLEQSDIFNPFQIGTRVYVTDPLTNRREGYTFTVESPSRFAGVFDIVRPTFIPDPGVTNTLTVQPIDLNMTDNNELISFAGGIPYNPGSGLFGAGYTLRTKDGVEFEIGGLTGDVESVRDRNNNTLTLTEAGLTSSTGQSITFERDPQGRITAVIDPMGEQITYDYDENGDLVSVTDRAGNTTQFDYSEERAHYLEEVIDPLGRSGVRSEYGKDGRLTRILDAAGAPLAFAYDPENFIQTSTEVLDEAGTLAVTIVEQDARGNILRQVNPDGGEITRIYDANGNVLSETNPLGHTTTFSYDASRNLLTETDPLGNVTSFTYNNFSDVTSSVDPLGNVTSLIYSGSNLTSSVDALGRVSNFEYDQAGNLLSSNDFSGFTQIQRGFTYDAAGNTLSETDSLGNTKIFTRDANGNLLSSSSDVTTGNGQETVTSTFTYDEEGRLRSITDAEGNTQITEYDALGQIIAEIDENGNRTEFTYNERGEQITITHPDGTTETFVYDLGGRQIAQNDKAGRTTFFVYDVMDRPVTTILPDETPEDFSDNPRIHQEYDLEGQLTATINPLGNRTEFVYDVVGRQIEAIDAQGNSTTIEYDISGREIATVDALGRNTQFTYDVINRLIETTFADGTTTTASYPEFGVEIRTDANDNETRFEYDAEGRLIAVEDALDNRTKYTYDELGRLIAQEDANDNVTNYEYDGLGRRISVTLAEGQESRTTYDAVGNIASKTDFNGDTISYQYDALNRLIKETLGNGDTVTYSYTATGQLATVLDSRGVTSFTYDQQDHLLSRTEPDGRAILYTYDLAGNRTSVSSPGGKTNYSYDSLNRISSIGDSEEGIAVYAYDAVGNLILTELANGTSETRAYDLLNRLQLLETTNAGGNILSSYEYTRDNVGNILQVEEIDRIVNYAYDPLARLVREEIIDSTNGNRDIEYTYDNVGNRLTRIDSFEGTTTNNYNNNNQLLTEEFNGDTTTYTYDENGQLITQESTDGKDSNFIWDSKSRLIQAAVNDGTITTTSEYEYDFEDIRVAQTINGEETKYLIDNSRDFPQVREESDSDGTVKARYTYGLGASPILIVRNDNVFYYHGDQVDSTRLLTDDVGNVTDRYIYDAFGIALARIGNTENNYLYTGEQRDPITGFNYLRARYLDSHTGRFISRDPFDGIVVSPISRNAYPYANQNPLRFTDPSGNFSLAELTTSVGISQIVQNIAPSFVIGFFTFFVIRDIWKPAFAARDAALFALTSTDNNVVIEGAIELYESSLKLIQTGSDLISLADEVVNFGSAFLSLGQATQSLVNSPGAIAKTGAAIQLLSAANNVNNTSKGIADELNKNRRTATDNSLEKEVTAFVDLFANILVSVRK